MVKRALIILGAGAARDLVPATGGAWLGSFDADYQPPLTADIFAVSALTRGVLDRYPGARHLAGKIRVDLQSGKALEPLLKELADTMDGPRASQFPELPLYLQDLFGEVSANFTNQPINYQRLADTLFAASSQLDEIAFVTLNYDTILDEVLAPHYLGTPIQTLNSYMTNKCLFVKLHGSVNWARAIARSYAPIGEFDDYLQVIRDLGNRHLGSALGPVQLHDPDVRWSPDGETLYYPALSVPLGEYDPYYACPARHVEALKGFLSDCRNVLVIGVSGRDGDLLALLRENLPPDMAHFALVDTSRALADEALVRFSAVPQLRTHHAEYTDGFSQFTLTDGPASFVASCR